MDKKQKVYDKDGILNKWEKMDYLISHMGKPVHLP